MKTVTTSAGALLLAIAASLFLVNWTSPGDLVLPHDPVFALSVRPLFWIAGGLALTVSLICLFDDRPARQMILLAWLATNFAAYECTLYWMGCNGLTGYLGGFSRTFSLPAAAANAFALASLGSLLALSYGSLLWLWRQKRLDRNFQKMSCPACGAHIKFALQNLGRKIPCPQCQTAITLREAESLKISCFFCQGHIEFPAHAIGEKMPCPHCQMDITLKEPVLTL
jgi:hypothetical protein